MKTRLLIIIALIIAVFLLVAVVYPTMNYRTWGNNELSYTPFDPGTKIVCDEWLWQPPQNCRSEHIITDPEIEGFVISDDKGNVKHYPIIELDRMPCEDFMSIFHPGMIRSEQGHLIRDKIASCVHDSDGNSITYEKP